MGAVAPIPDSYWLVDDWLLAGEYPGAYDETEAREKLEMFVAAGIRSFIDLTERDEPLRPYESLLNEVAGALGMDLRYRRFGIPDLGVPPMEHMRAILEAIRVEIEAGRPVYVHCWGGIGRTGTVAGCWLVEKGMSGESALARIRGLRSGTPDGHRRSPETQEQCDFVCAWKPSPRV